MGISWVQVPTTYCPHGFATADVRNEVCRGRHVSREECPTTSAGHSPCLREVNVPDGSRSPLPSPDTVVCQERVTRHLAFCPTPAPATIRYAVPSARTAHPATLSTMGDRQALAGRFASTSQHRTAGKPF